MTLPEKNYYYLQELIDRWGIPGIDLRYYAEQGELEIQTWLDETMVVISRAARTEDGVVGTVQIGVSTYKGYAVVEPDELRKIFSSSPQPIVLFRIPNTDEAIKIHRNHKKPMIGTEDLVVAKTVRDAFEKKHGIVTRHASTICTTISSFSGRPSTMHLVLKEFYRRCNTAAVASSLQKEAQYLAAWAAENIEDAQTPKAKTIMNVLRPEYRAYRQGGQRSSGMDATHGELKERLA